jgi:HAMP domain-containing protein
MNLSLKNRIALSFTGANFMVLAIGFTVFYFLNSLNTQIETITDSSNKLTLLTDEVRISAVSILKMQKKIITNRANEQDLEKLGVLCDSFHQQLQRLDTYYTEVEAKTVISKMIGYVDSLKTLLSKASIYSRDNTGLLAIGDLADKILEAFSDFQDVQYFRNEQRDKQVKNIITETKKNMLLTLILTFLMTILLSLFIPAKIALPFKKINDAVRELQDCNFDVSIYYNKDDEIGELASELNKMISSIKHFEALRVDKISVEHRKFDILANMIKRNVLISNARGELVYLNNKCYKMLGLESQDVLNKPMADTLVPQSIKDTFELALKRRSKLDSHEVIITEKTKEEVEQEVTSEDGEEEVETKVVEVEEEIFKGYANVIPIRAKESSLDYYMMVLEREVVS